MNQQPMKLAQRVDELSAHYARVFAPAELRSRINAADVAVKRFDAHNAGKTLTRLGLSTQQAQVTELRALQAALARVS